MKIVIRLMGMLKDREPPGNSLDISENSTILKVLEQLQIESDSVHVFTVNGALQRDKEYVLQPNDELTVLPPVGGG